MAPAGKTLRMPHADGLRNASAAADGKVMRELRDLPYPFLEPGVIMQSLKGPLEQIAAEPGRWEAYLADLISELGGESQMGEISPFERVHLFMLCATALSTHRGVESIRKMLEGRLRDSGKDFLLRYLYAGIVNYLGEDSVTRSRLVNEIVSVQANRPSPSFEFRPPRGERKPLLSVAFSTWNRWESLIRTLNSLRERTCVPYEVIVYDNNSTDDTSSFLRRLQLGWPELGVVYSAGHCYNIPSYNVALSRTRGAIVGFLADDVEVLPGWDQSLASALMSSESVGAVHPLVLNPDGTIFFLSGECGCSSRRFPWLNRIKSADKLEGRRVDEVALSREPRPIAVGLYLFMRREVYRRLSVFDPRFVHHWADYDASLQIRREGLDVLVCPGSMVIDRIMPSVEHQGCADSRIVEGVAELFFDPAAAFERLKAGESRFWRFFRDRLLFECKWYAYRADGLF